MPLYLTAKLKGFKYSSEKFVNWYISFPDIQKGYKGSKDLKNRKDLIYIVSSYYFWVFYIVSVVIISTINIWVAIIGAVFSPFIVSGYIYAVAYTHQEYRKLMRKHR